MAGYADLQNLQVQRVVANLAAGLTWGQQFIAEDVLPPVNTGSENFAYATWGNEGMRDVETRRGIDAEPVKITLSTGTATAELEEHAVETYYDYRRLKAAEEAGSGDTFRLNHAAMLRQLVAIQKEKSVASIVFGSANYTGRTNAASAFSAAGVRDIIIQRKDERQRATGVRPNVFIAGQSTHRQLLKNPDIISTIQYSRGGITTAQLIAEYLEVDKYLVGTAVSQAPAAAGATGTATSLWTVDSAALIYTDTLPNTASPCFGKTFYMNVPETGSRVYTATWVPDPRLNEWLIYREFFKPATVFTACGYLWTATT